MNIRAIITILLALCFSLESVSLVYANQKLIAVRKAYFSTTGKKWDDATPREKKKFLKRFSTEESRDERQQRAMQRNIDREEAREERQRDREYTSLQRTIRTRERAKQMEKRNWLREKKIRERELAIAKKKLIKARQKFESQKNR